MFKTIGIPCCHSFSVMKAMNMHHIPETVIMQRWTINAKDVSEVDSSSSAAPTNIIQIARYGALSSKCSKMCYYASMSTEGYKEANMAIDKLTIQMNGLLPSSSRSMEEHVHRRSKQSTVQVKDPVIAATRGPMRQNKKSSGKTRKCGKCGQPGHTAKTCRAHAKNYMSAMASNGVAGTWSTLQPTAYADLLRTCESGYNLDSDGRCQPFAQFTTQLNGDVFSITNLTPDMYMQQNHC
ncbi:hypothetical protein Dsin_001668 [Dipteronia sinensis]|uniref:Protein FAR1-RELATED SEQUENCE n=1 Tax=Dipteronia sinensis TaxID=43782 RepID=A0AAE0B4R3_9ROSI|nr:hypothetical protein Dsin_001668 [Dipteronia sinensis]